MIGATLATLAATATTTDKSSSRTAAERINSPDAVAAVVGGTIDSRLAICPQEACPRCRRSTQTIRWRRL